MAETGPLPLITVVYDANGNLYSVSMKKETWVAFVVVYVDRKLPMGRHLTTARNNATGPARQLPQEVLEMINEEVHQEDRLQLADDLVLFRKCGLIKNCIPVEHLTNDQQKVAHMCLNRLGPNPHRVSRATKDPVIARQVMKKAKQENRRQRNGRNRPPPPDEISYGDLPAFPRERLPSGYLFRLNWALVKNNRMRNGVQDKNGRDYFPPWPKCHNAIVDKYTNCMDAVSIVVEVEKHFNLVIEPSRLIASDGREPVAGLWELTDSRAAIFNLMAPATEGGRDLFCRMLNRLGFGRVRAKGVPTPLVMAGIPEERLSLTRASFWEMEDDEEDQMPLTLWFDETKTA